MQTEREQWRERGDSSDKGGDARPRPSSEDSDDDDVRANRPGAGLRHKYFDQLAGAAMMDESGDGPDAQCSTKINEKTQAAVEDDDWYQAMIDHASRTSVVKHESDSVWDNVLRTVVSQTVKEDVTFEAAVPIDSDLSFLVLRRFLESSLPRTSTLVSCLESAGPESRWFVDRLLDPNVAVGVRGHGAERVELWVYALDASSVRAVLGGCLPPCSQLVLHLVDPILEGALAALCHARGLHVTAREDQVLYATPSSVTVPRVPKHPRERSDLQVLPLPSPLPSGEGGGNSDTSSGNGKLPAASAGACSTEAVACYGLFCEGNLIGQTSISPHGRVESIAVAAGYQGRGFEGYMLNEILETCRRQSGGNVRPHFWMPRGDGSQEESGLSTLGFEPVAEAANLHACKR